MNQTQNNFAGGEISPRLYGRTDLDQYLRSLAELENYLVLPHGGATRRPGTKYVCAVKDSSYAPRIIPFEASSDVSYLLEVGAGYIRFVKDGVQLGAPYEISNPYGSGDLADIRFVQSIDVMWLVHPDYAVRRLVRTADTDWTLSEEVFIDGPYDLVNSDTENNVQATTTTTADAATATIGTGNAAVKYTADIAGSTGNSYTVEHTFNTPGPTSLDVVIINNPSTTTIRVYLEHDGTNILSTAQEVADAVNADPEASLIVDATLPGTGADLAVEDTEAMTGGTDYVVELYSVDASFVSTDVGRLIRVFNSTEAEWTWGEITAFTNTRQVTVTVYGDHDFPGTAIKTSLWRLGKYSDTTGHPANAMLFEQRLGFAGSTTFPEAIDLSQTDAYTVFATSAPLVDTDALGYTLGGNQANIIQWLMPTAKGLAIGTTGGEWIFSGISGAALTPTTPPSARRQTTIGCADIAPVHSGTSILFVNRSKRRLHEMAYLFEEDGYRAPDMTLLAEHLFRTETIEEMGYQKSEDLVWTVRSDGTLVGLTYLRPESVVAWHRHTTDGDFERVACVFESTRDVPYFVVKRTIDGNTVRYIEYLEDRFTGTREDSDFMDAGITYDSTPATTITGLDHLEGEAVSVVADGYQITGKTVASGQIDLDYAASKVHVGLPYTSTLKTLPLEAIFKDGSTMGRQKTVVKAIVKLYDTFGVSVGTEDLQEASFWAPPTFGSLIELFEGDKEVFFEDVTDTIKQVVVQQDGPFPGTILAITMDWKVTE